MKLRDRVAAITGGTRGIGRGIAEAFLAEGAHVVLNGRSQARGAQALTELDAGDAAAFIAGDVTQQAQVEALIDGTVARYGRIDMGAVDLMREKGPEAAAAMGVTYAEYLEGYAQEAAIKRLNTVEEVAAVAVLLASEVGAGITGALVDVHGGTLL